MKSILITGGTGFFGKSILDYFSRHPCPYEFTILSRKGFQTTNLANSANLNAAQLPPSPNSCNSCNSWLNTPTPATSIPNSLNSLNSLLNLTPSTPSTLNSQPSTRNSCNSCNSWLNTPTQLLGDVRTFELPLGAHFDYIIHAATPARADIPDDEMRSIIIDGTANALRQAKKCGATKFMMVSSGGVYGKGFTRPVSEDDAPHPYTAYGKAKLEAEQMAIDSGLYTLIPRCFAFVGRHLDRNAHFAIGNFIRDALAGHDIIINGDGTPMRSYMYADDLVEWLFAILERGASGRPYNVGSPDAISIRDLAQTVLTTLNSCNSCNSWLNPNNQQVQNLKILGSPVPGAANYYVPIVTRVLSELGLSLHFDLPASISQSV